MTSSEKHYWYASFGGPGIYLNLRNSEGYRKAWQEARDTAIRKVNNLIYTNMAKLQLFTVAAILHPEQKKDGTFKGDSELIFKPETRLEKDSELLAKKILRKLPEKYEDILERVEILVRPF